MVVAELNMNPPQEYMRNINKYTDAVQYCMSNKYTEKFGQYDYQVQKS